MGVVYPTDGDETLAAAGLHLALEPMLRLGEYGALGISVQHSRLDWQARGPETGPMPFAEFFPDDDGFVIATTVGLAGRWYLLGDALFTPYLQAAIGVGDYIQLPDHPQCGVEDVLFPSLSGGVDYSLRDTFRVGLSTNAFLFGLGMSCTERGLVGEPPAPPWPGMGVAIRGSVTSVWGG